MRRKVHNITDGRCCGNCRHYTHKGRKVYGRCSTTTMVDTDAYGDAIPESERPAARFETDCCDHHGSEDRR